MTVTQIVGREEELASVFALVDDVPEGLSAPAETVALQVLPFGATRRVDMPAPGNCEL